MTRIVVAALLAVAPLTAVWAYDSCKQDEMAYATLESVREVPLRKDPSALADVFEHVINPETEDELVLCFDYGCCDTVVQSRIHGVQLGQRVVIIPGRRGARVEQI